MVTPGAAIVSRVTYGRKAIHNIADNVIVAARCHAFVSVTPPVTVRVVRSAIGDTSSRWTQTVHPSSEQPPDGGLVFAVARHGFLL